MKHIFTEKGSYKIELTVSDHQFSSNKTHKIKIEQDSKTQNKEKTTKKNNDHNDDIVEITLSDIRKLSPDTKIKTRGIVSALPNTFSKTIMYLAGSGVQLYMYKANCPQ